jgi:hypothetical protein
MAMSRVPLVRPALLAGLGVCVALLLWALPGASGETPAKAAAEEKALAASLKKAAIDGKYQMLLRQIKVADDKENYGDFSDYGPYGGTDYAGFTDLPKGHWVYVYPYWYIWRGLKEPKQTRGWGPEQATGAPDTNEAGDFTTAWASRTPDEQDEWLMLEYAEPIRPKEIVVHETYNPGAVTRVTAFKLDGTEVEVWKGKDPSAGKDIGTSKLPFKGDFLTNRIKLHIESTKVPGWNEIDAVGLTDAKGKTFWAIAAEASSTYAEQGTPTPPADPRDQRIRQLEREVRQLKQTIKKLEEMVDKLDKLKQTIKKLEEMVDKLDKQKDK